MAALTSGTIPVATDGTHIANSLLTDNATTLAYNTNKFTVTAASGNTVIAGTTSFAGKLFPASDDGAALGDTTHNFSDLFLATGALINFANSNAVITHSSGILTVSTGDLRVTTAGTNAASVVTLNGTQTLANKTLTASTNVLGGVTMTLGSDADGDIYYRASNVLTRLAKGTGLQGLRMNAGATAPEWAAAAGTGDVVGPASATDNAIVRFDGTTGKLVQNSVVTVADTTGNISTVGSVSTGVGSGAAGTVVLTEGTAPSLTANAFSIYAPADVAAGGLAYITPAAAATGFILATNAAGVMTLSHVASTGSGSVVLATSPSLTTPVLGTPSSGTLSACTVDGTNLVGFKGMPQNSQSTAYTTVLGDAGKHILHPTADNNARTFTIDSNANVAYVIGTTITFINQINTLTLSITSDSLVWLPTGGTGSRTIAANGLATAVKVAATVWNLTGVGIT